MIKQFEVLSAGLCCASVCSCLPLKEITKRLNSEHPTGILSKWGLSEEKEFADGSPNPCHCQDSPDNKHYLFNC